MNDFTHKEVLYLSKDIEDDNPKELIVPERLHYPHKLIKAYKENAKPVEEFRTDITRFLGGENQLKIEVTKTTFKRALLFFNTFIKLSNARNHEVLIKDGKTFVKIKGQELAVKLREPNKTHDREGKYGWNERTYTPIGDLSFRYERWSMEKEWRDTKNVKIEQKLSVIMAFLEIKAEEEIRWQKQIELDRKTRERESELKAFHNKIKADERKAFNKLLTDADRWAKYLKLKNYIDQIEKDKSKSEEWISWATQKANWIDPRTDIEDEILGKFENN